MKNDILKSLIVPKNLKDPLGFSNIYYVPKYQKIEGGPLGTIKKFSKSLIMPKKITQS